MPAREYPRHPWRAPTDRHTQIPWTTSPDRGGGFSPYKHTDTLLSTWHAQPATFGMGPEAGSGWSRRSATAQRLLSWAKRGDACSPTCNPPPRPPPLCPPHPGAATAAIHWTPPAHPQLLRAQLNPGPPTKGAAFSIHNLPTMPRHAGLNQTATKGTPRTGVRRQRGSAAQGRDPDRLCYLGWSKAGIQGGSRQAHHPAFSISPELRSSPAPCSSSSTLPPPVAGALAQRRKSALSAAFCPYQKTALGWQGRENARGRSRSCHPACETASVPVLLSSTSPLSPHHPVPGKTSNPCQTPAPTSQEAPFPPRITMRWVCVWGASVRRRMCEWKGECMWTQHPLVCPPSGYSRLPPIRATTYDEQCKE